MTFDDLREYLGGAGDRYGYRGSFDSCTLMIMTTNGLVPVGSAQIHIDEGGTGSIVLSPEETNGNIG
jgi:hypothetical protein